MCSPLPAPMAAIACVAAIAGVTGGCNLFDCAATYVPRPPPAALEVPLPSAFFEGLEHTDGGHPILISTRAAGIGLSLAYDATLDTPVVRWAACLDRVLACRAANRGRSFAGCVPLIARCAQDAGLAPCCPSACLDAFTARLREGADERAALRDTIERGDCVPGYSDYVDGGLR